MKYDLYYYIIFLLFYQYRERERALAQGGAPLIQPSHGSDQARFTGGGFNLKQPLAQTKTAVA